MAQVLEEGHHQFAPDARNRTDRCDAIGDLMNLLLADFYVHVDRNHLHTRSRLSQGYVKGARAYINHNITKTCASSTLSPFKSSISTTFGCRSFALDSEVICKAVCLIFRFSFHGHLICRTFVCLLFFPSFNSFFYFRQTMQSVNDPFSRFLRPNTRRKAVLS